MRLHISTGQLKTIKAGALLAAATYRLRAAEYLLSEQRDSNEFEHRGWREYPDIDEMIAKAERNAIVQNDMADAQLEIARIATEALANQENKEAPK